MEHIFSIKRNTFLLFLFFSISAIAQKQANVWHFGNGIALDFNTGEPVQITGSAMRAFGAPSSYCDSLGNLLFYTNGGGREPNFNGVDQGHIWNRNNAVMHNMQGVEGGGGGTSQSSVIVEAPGQPEKYYVFTMEETQFTIGASPATNAAQPLGRGLSFFTVDMTLNAGLGGVVDIDQRVFTPSYEGLCAVRHANQQDYWILINQDTLGISVYSLTAAGISFNNTYTLVNQNTTFGLNPGIIKASPNGAFVRSGSNLLNFNTTTGQFSNPITIASGAEVFEFSPNSNYMYESIPDSATSGLLIMRYNLLSSNVQNSFETIGQVDLATGGSIPCQMQLGPDGKIYFLELSVVMGFYLHRISCPNGLTPSIETVLSDLDGFFLGFPNFPAWLFKNEDNVTVSLGPENLILCATDFPYTIDAQNSGATYLWSNGQTTQTIQVTQPGNYSVLVTDFCGTGRDTISITLCAVTSTCIDFLPTGNNQFLNIPTGVDSIQVKMWGAAGGGGADPVNNAGGGGGYTQFTLPVVAGDLLEVVVGLGGQPAIGNTGGNGGWPTGGNGGDGNRNESLAGVPTDVGGGGGGGGKTLIRITGSINELLAVAGAGGGAAYNRAGGGGGGLQAEYTTASNSFNINGFGGSQTAGGAPGNNDICPPPVLGQAGFSLGGGNGATDLADPNSAGGGGGDGFFGGGGGSSHDGCFGVGSTGGGGSGYLCATCPGISGTTITAGFVGLPANETDALLSSYPGTATGVNNSIGGGGLVQICYTITNNCVTINTNITQASCSSYISAAGYVYNQSGTFTETFIASNGCDSVLTLNLTINPTIEGPEITVNPENISILLGASAQLQAFGGLTYLWSPTQGLSCETCSDPIASPDLTTTYIVTGFDANGCLNTASVVVNVDNPCGQLFIPTIFSPDGKGSSKNETLCIYGVCIKELKYEVYNRWGQVVFLSTEKSSCWDGTFNGKPCETGAYLYKVYVLLNDGTTKEEAGNLTLIR